MNTYGNGHVNLLDISLLRVLIDSKHTMHYTKC